MPLVEAAGPGAGAGRCDCCCCDGKNAWGIIIKGWFPVGIMGVAPGAAPGAPPLGGIIMGTIIIIYRDRDRATGEQR